MRVRMAVALLTSVALLAGCSGTDSDEVLVLAASSLTDALRDVAAAYETAEPGITVTLSFGGSSAIREQVLAGAPADVVVLAGVDVMDDLAGAVTEPVLIASNTPVLVVPAGNPGGVTELTDLTDDALLVGLCRSAVPCGALADELLATSNIEARVDTREPDVRALLGKVVDGELDAGIVYATDALAAGDAVEVIALPAEDVPATAYPAALLADAPHPAAGRAFIDLLRSDVGQQALADRGFGPSP